MDQQPVTYFENSINACLECDLCKKVQTQLGCHEHNYAEFARMMLDASNKNNFKNVSHPAWSCTLCGSCTTHCPVGIDAYDFMYHTRSVLSSKEPHIVERFSPMRTNESTNVFAQMRQLQTTFEPDALETGLSCQKLFFPGCVLGTYAPNLVQTVFNHLRQNFNVGGITFSCCGNPFTFMGDPDTLDKMSKAIATKLRASDVQEIITACPSCYYALSSYQRNGILDHSTTITALPSLLADEGLTVDPQVLDQLGFSDISIQDACRDRVDGVFSNNVRRILSTLPLVELKHHGRTSRCCGSGGLVPLYDEDEADQRRWALLEEFDDTGASCLVTMCLNCSLALRQDGDENIFHYLELLFNQPVDWDQAARIQQRLGSTD